MTAFSVSQATRATGLSRITITRAIKARWHSASRKEDGSYEMTPRPTLGEARAIPNPMAQGHRCDGRGRAKAAGSSS